mmetsp:Transcript_56204/g.133935  ORF Transcript_56204/g.133935 Transcript_56204/m.133935 type:complete len:125 (+) Transcript_56204:98-472(+)|eukprot:CAMPEP_0178399026 /NCGR_PEP_ID=MMETSP0689_2-20121128/15070_1 /TAXON_ID=160604 /ORGANISM="Amphidinium massartii, Strain CS-259" /LENGTH=124 /DNA_ID=CAMNT_0020019795 /DNA_START=94 /DNA_END=468 /DNA_ORIENTATION=+
MALRLAALCFALFGSAAAFVPQGVTQKSVQFSAPRTASVQTGTAVPEETSSSAYWASCMLAGASIGYAAAVASGTVARKAEKVAAAKTPVAYPIFTFRWLAVHTLVIPTVFFLGAISSMQFIQR